MKFSAMASEVERALHLKRDAEKEAQRARDALAHAEAELKLANEQLREARDAMFREFPELAPAMPLERVAPPAAPVKPAEPAPVMSPQGPLVFRELPDDFMPEA